MSVVLVTGGTGRLGRVLLPRLVAARHEVRALVRRPDAVLPAGVEAVRGDLGIPPLPARALDSVTHIVHLASGSAGGQIEAVDLAGTRALIEAARAAGRLHLIYLSIVGVEQVPSPLYRAKVEVEAMLAASGLPWTSLRTPQFHELIWGSFNRPSAAPFLVEGRRYQPVACADVADFVIGLLTRPPANAVVEMGGPEVFEAAELAAIYAEVMGQPRPGLRPAPESPGETRDALTTPSHREGRVTWRQYLEAQRDGVTL